MTITASYFRSLLNYKTTRVLAHTLTTNSRDFRGMSDLEIEKWNEYSRLLANIIIFCNATLLSELMVLNKQQGDFEATFIRKLPLAAIQHINLKKDSTNFAKASVQ